MTPEEVEGKAFNAVDDYLKRSLIENLSFYDMDNVYSNIWGYAKKLLLDNVLVSYRAGDNSITDLTERGRVVAKYGIRVFLESKSESGIIRAENEKLQNHLLKEQERNRILESDLKDTQYQLANAQIKEIKNRDWKDITKDAIRLLVAAAIGFVIRSFMG